MFDRLKNIFQTTINLSKAAVRGAIQGSGTAALYFCTSTLLAAILLTAYLTYAWDIDKQKWYRAYAILQGIELDEIQQAEQDRAGDVYYEKVLEARAERTLSDEFQQIRQTVFSQPPPPVLPMPEPPSVPNDADLISAFDRHVNAARANAQSEGLSNLIETIERMPPDQAKEVIRRLWQETPRRVLEVLMGVDERVRQKILNSMQATVDEELKDLCDILQRIGNGEPMSSIIDEAANQP